jgi:hypothetical protein
MVGRRSTWRPSQHARTHRWLPYARTRNACCHKLNTRSSTESEIVVVDDLMPIILWTNYFLEAQGYGTTSSILYQDNKSAILLENNGRKSSSKQTKHITIRYYFITDRIRKNELSVEHCPTGDMVADLFTKPLQGKLFYKFRSIILNIKDD